MVGIIQNMLSYNATFRYGDGDRVANGQTPSLDQMKPTPGPIPFYSAASSKSIAACETTTLSFEDTPEAASTRFNTCEGRNQLFQSISVKNSLETWLVAKHSPSGCYTVLKHFTWGQTAQTPPEAHETHTSSIDNSPGEDVSRIKLKEPIFNHTVGDGDCQPPPN